MYQKMPDIPYILTFREAQQVLKTGKNTLLELIHSGELRAFRIGNRWKITRDAILDYVQG